MLQRLVSLDSSVRVHANAHAGAVPLVSARSSRSTAVVIAAPVLAVIFLYYWAVRATGDPFWHDDAGGYYDLLARAFAGGHLYLPVEPDPALLALPDPLDSKRNEGLGLHDLALYGGRYYLYHGATPAILLFTPWYLASHRNLSQRFAALFFSIGGYGLSCALLLMLMARL